jgi:hypothetical protein
MPPVEVHPPLPLDAVFPELVKPLRQLLEREGEADLAASVTRLRVHALCGCGDAFCASFYTRPRNANQASPYTIGPDSAADPFEPVAVDVSDGEVSFVEIIDADLPALADLKRRYDDLVRQARRESA